jgi:mlo protein
MGAGRNLEQTSSLYIGIMLMVFVFFSKLVEQFFHQAKHWLQHHHEISLVAVLEHIKDEIMLVGVLAMMLIMVESSIAEICVNKADDFTPAYKQPACKELWAAWRSEYEGAGSSSTGSNASSTSSSGRRLGIGSMHHRSSSTRTLLAASSSAAGSSGAGGTICPEGQTPFMDINAIHQVHFLIFFLACTHIVYSIAIVMTSRMWARSLEKWEKDVLKGGTVMSKNENKPPQIPSNVFGEYLDAFKKQFTHLHLKGMDSFTAGVLRQFYIISQGKDANYKFFTVVREELEQDFDEICGIDSLLWLFTGISLMSEGSASAQGIPMAGTLFCMGMSLVIGTNLMVVIERLIRDVYKRMVAHNIKSPITLQNSLSERTTNVENGIEVTNVENTVKVKDITKNVFHEPTPIKADLGMFGYGKTIWLWGIKFCMFEFSRKLTYIVFYSHQFRKTGSCYRNSRTDLSTYLSVFCCVFFNFYIGIKLIPMYSIATHVAMHQRKVSYMHKLAKGMHKIHQIEHFLDGAAGHGHHGHGHNSVKKGSHSFSNYDEHGNAKRNTFSVGASSSSQSKYVVPPPQNTELSDQEHMIQQHLEHTSEEESHDHDDDDVLPDSIGG